MSVLACLTAPDPKLIVDVIESRRGIQEVKSKDSTVTLDEFKLTHL